MRKEIKLKKGVTSIVVILFVILIFGVITVSFSRLMLSEATQSTNNDLSQSAYDSALAGLEDAKTALLKYHACLSSYGNMSLSSAECQVIVSAMQAGIKDQDCDTVAKALGRKTDNDGDGKSEGVIVQETQSASANGNSADMLQAYTCVTIEEELADYRTTLNADNALRLVPIRVNASRIDSVDYIEVSWFSRENLKNIGGSNNHCAGLPSLRGCNGSYLAPTLLGVGLIQTDVQFKLAELSMANDQSPHNTDRAQIYLKPEPLYNTTEAVTDIPATDFSSTSSASINDTFGVRCNTGNETRTGFYCSARIGIPKPFNGGNRNTGSFFVLLSLPYTVPETDVSLKVFNKAASGGFVNSIPLVGVQARVDSTGRANDLYRRVESRIELVDTFFPYPQYEIQMSNNASSIIKSFWSTYNCWTTNVNGTKSSCPNYREAINLGRW